MRGKEEKQGREIKKRGETKGTRTKGKSEERRGLKV